MLQTSDSAKKGMDFGEPASSIRLISVPVLSLILFAGTVILYFPASRNAFVNYDDDTYVSANAQVLQGLSWSNIAWAFKATEEANWHPLTWISHMADVQFFGTNPRGHHLVSIFLHAFNVVLLFLVLRRATSNVARSAVVAALFAVHPLNVECVAWVAERKSLLSMFFFLLALAAYGWYVRRRNPARYLVVVLLYALGLAAKPMIVALPLLLLLWDYWPLQLDVSVAESASRPKALLLVAEKIPLFALSAASSWITLYAQHRGGALAISEALPLRLRIANAIYSYVIYLVKGIWPSGLSVFYPHPENSLVAWRVSAAALILAAITVLAWIFRNRRRYLLTAWLWYVAALFPMIGIVQVGRQAMADRYAYLPFVGLFVIAVWGVADLFVEFGLSPVIRVALTVAVLVGYASVTFLQINYWRNSYTLFAHALAVTSGNAIAEDNFGAVLLEMGRPDLALPHFEAAVAFMPQLATAHYNLGLLAQQQGRSDAALHEYQLAAQYVSDPREATRVHNNLGFLLLDLNDSRSALEQFNAALQINPHKQNSLLGRGMAEYRQGNLDSAVRDLSHAAQIAPLAQADFWLGRALEEKGQLQDAISAYNAALELNPGMIEAQRHRDALREHH